jgi:hypothetical protein
VKRTDPRERLAKVITFLAGLYFVLEFLLPESILTGVGVTQSHEAITNGFTAAVYVSIGLGILNLLLHHGKVIVFRRPGTGYSAILLIGLGLMMGVTTVDWLGSLRDARAVGRIGLIGRYAQQIHDDAEQKRADVPGYEHRIQLLLPELSKIVEQLRSHRIDDGLVRDIDQIGEGLRASGQDKQQNLLSASATLKKAQAQLLIRLSEERDAGINHKLYTFLFDGIFTSLASAMFSLLAFYIAAAAYRAFKIRSMESFLMMAAAVLVILGQTAVGVMISESFPRVRLWLLEVPNAGAFRAIKLGSAVAALILCFRMWLSLESRSISSGPGDA